MSQHHVHPSYNLSHHSDHCFSSPIYQKWRQCQWCSIYNVVYVRKSYTRVYIDLSHGSEYCRLTSQCSLYINIQKSLQDFIRHFIVVYSLYTLKKNCLTTQKATLYDNKTTSLKMVFKIHKNKSLSLKKQLETQ